MITINKSLAAITVFLFCATHTVIAKEYHVAVTGSDAAAGTALKPFRTIQQAADIMKQGDVCIVHAGTYREWIKPPRGGESDDKRITYKAAPGEEVILKGSEQFSKWTNQNGIWKAEIPDSFFGKKNPFKRNIEGEWLFYGFDHTLGDIYLNGKSLTEKFSREEVKNSSLAWFVEPLPGKTVLYANFGAADPNSELTEINVRESIFFPEIKGLKYITLQGLHFSQAAPGWAYWNVYEEAAVGTCFGYKWIIQDCTFTNSRCVALVCGNDPCKPDEGQDITYVGRHIIRNNYFAWCGEAAIHGNWGWSGSLIEGNLIEDINTKNEFGGMETAGMKIHYAVDVTVKGNIVRRIYGKDRDPEKRPAKYKGWTMQCTAVWIDWGAQGTRVTGNIVYDSEAWAVFIQNSNGSPVLVDNNIFVGEARVNSRGVIFAHNMFINSKWTINKGARGPYWKPHSGELAGVVDNIIENEKWWNNILIGKGADTFPQGEGLESDWNVFYGGAQKTKWGDANSMTDPFDPGIKFTTLPDGVEVTFLTNKAPVEVKAPLITRDFAPVFKLTGQGIEDADGKPVTINKDILGLPRSNVNPAAGPLENISDISNTVKLLAGVKN